MMMIPAFAFPAALLLKVVFEAEASGGWGKAGGLPHPSLSLPSPFPFPLSFQTNQWEGKSDPVRRKFPGFPATATSLLPGYY